MNEAQPGLCATPLHFSIRCHHLSSSFSLLSLGASVIQNDDDLKRLHCESFLVAAVKEGFVDLALV